jgi:hypothetical protein
MDAKRVDATTKADIAKHKAADDAEARVAKQAEFGYTE